jgi:hypothetical protein
MAEWSNAAVLKTVRLARVSWVRIPVSPPEIKNGRSRVAWRFLLSIESGFEPRVREIAKKSARADF